MSQADVINRVRGNFVKENASFFSTALENIHDDVMKMADSAGSVFTFNYLLDVGFNRLAKKHFNEAYNKMWSRTPVYFATESFKKLSNTKALADIFNPINAFRSNLDARVQIVANTTLGKYRSTLKEGQTLTNDIRQIAELMDTNVRGAYIRLRSMQIARTETVFASNVGRRAGAIATGLPLVKTWVTMQDNDVRDPHAFANGQQRPLSQPFRVNNELLMFPSDFTLGASASNIINCRCVESYTIA